MRLTDNVYQFGGSDMKLHQHFLRSMTDENIKAFIVCPYKLYYEFIDKKKSPVDWKQIVQHVVNKVVYSYFQLPIEQRNATKILSLLEQFWSKVPIQKFESRIQFYTVAAKMTDYLIRYLTRETNPTPPLFLFEKFKANIEELDVDLSLTFDVAEWSESSFIVKKYLVEAKPDMLMLYYYLTIVFSKKVFKKIPEKIEVITILDGKKHTYTPTPENMEEGINYLKLIKHLLGDSSSFNELFTEEQCAVCPFERVCERGARKGTENNYLS